MWVSYVTGKDSVTWVISMVTQDTQHAGSWKEEPGLGSKPRRSEVECRPPSHRPTTSPSDLTGEGSEGQQWG